MSRCAGFGLILVVALVIGGCSGSKPEPPQTPAQKPQTPAAGPVVDNEAPPAGTKTPAAADFPSKPGAPATDVTEAKPTVLGAIRRAVAGALGASEEEQPSEAPGDRPPQ